VGVVTAMTGYVAVFATLTAAGLVFTTYFLGGWIGQADDRTVNWLADHRTPALDTWTAVLSRSADTEGAVALALVVAACLALRRHWSTVALLATALVLELLTFLAVNAVVGRPRPAVAALGSVPTTSSFPSGHTAAALVIYTCIALAVSKWCDHVLIKILVWTVAILMPIAVGFARVYRGMHHPVDVMAGYLLGLAALTVAVAALQAFDEARRHAHAHERCETTSPEVPEVPEVVVA
jgi:undecaprenyl-diphosphatase